MSVAFDPVAGGFAARGERVAYLDALKAIAIVGVIVLHVGAGVFYQSSMVGTSTWWVANVLDAATRFTVPVFVMVSGALLLGRPMDTLTFYRRRALRLLPPLLFWSAVYALFTGLTDPSIDFLYYLKVQIFVQGRAATHLWFLTMYVCLMPFVPFVNKLIVGQAATRLDLLIFALLLIPFFALNELSDIVRATLGFDIAWFKNFPFFIGYLVLGYAIDRHAGSIRIRGPAALLGALIIALAGAALNAAFLHRYGKMSDYLFLGNDGVLVLLQSCCVFYWARSARLGANPVVGRLADAAFGIYLLHPLVEFVVLRALAAAGLGGLAAMAVTIAATLALSFVMIGGARRVPALRALC